jgi:hypothetical protein
VDLAVVNMLDAQFHQLLAEEAPEVRSQTNATLGEAIRCA